jgi:hypothetical protein
LTEVGEFEFTIQDEWGQGIPLTDSMTGIITSGLAVMSIMALLKDVFEEVLE